MEFPIRQVGEHRHREGLERAADEVLIVCDRLDKAEFGQNLAACAN